LWMTLSEFRRDFGIRKLQSPGLSYGVVCVILRLVVNWPLFIIYRNYVSILHHF